MVKVSDDIIDSAIRHVECGYKIFPCKPNAKEPLGRLVPSGVKDATADIDRVRRWWAEEPAANIGVATGGGLVVIDVDYDPVTGLDGYQSLAELEEKYGALHHSYRVQTPRGGMHIYLRVPDGHTIKNSTGKLGIGIDVRGEGGYVIGAGSQIDMVYYTEISIK